MALPAHFDSILPTLTDGYSLVGKDPSPQPTRLKNIDASSCIIVNGRHAHLINYDLIDRAEGKTGDSDLPIDDGNVQRVNGMLQVRSGMDRIATTCALLPTGGGNLQSVTVHNNRAFTIDSQSSVTIIDLERVLIDPDPESNAKRQRRSTVTATVTDDDGDQVVDDGGNFAWSMRQSSTFPQFSEIKSRTAWSGIATFQNGTGLATANYLGSCLNFLDVETLSCLRSLTTGLNPTAVANDPSTTWTTLQNIALIAEGAGILSAWDHRLREGCVARESVCRSQLWTVLNL
jgi:hypothetical protein